MASPVIMPRQGQSVETCIITEWKKQKGDIVKKGDVLFVYETDKASFEEESGEDGVLLETFFREGDEVPVLTNVAVIGREGESTSEFMPRMQEKEEKQEEQVTPPPAMQESELPEWQSADTDADGSIKISPRARKLADRLKMPVNYIKGSGPAGRIVERDIMNQEVQPGRISPAAQAKASAEKLTIPPAGNGIGQRIIMQDLTDTPAGAVSDANDYEIQKITNVRKIIAEAMHRSLQNSAQLTHHISANAEKMLKIRKKTKKLVKQGFPNISLNDLICFAVIKALKKHPQANSHFMGDTIRVFKKVHLGIAVDTPRGLMVPAIKNADTLTLEELSHQIKKIAEQCRKGNINPELLSAEAASFTVSNLGAYGIEMFTPVLNLPQAGILGVNAIVQRPVENEKGKIKLAPFIGFSLTYDHRALDGAPASAFLKEIKDQTENINFEMNYKLKN